MKNLEEIVDRSKFADIDVAIHYGDNLLKNITNLSKHIKSLMDNAKEYKLPENIMTDLGEAALETRMMHIAVNDMRSYLVGYKEKTSPADDIGATEEWGFTEEEIEKAKKKQLENSTPEDVELEKSDPEKFQDEKSL